MKDLIPSPRQSTAQGARAVSLAERVVKILSLLMLEAGFANVTVGERGDGGLDA